MKFRHADPSRRTPTYLQAYTVENLVWQLKLLVGFAAVYLPYTYIKDKREMRVRIRELHTTD